MGILKGPCNRLLLPQVKSMGSPANTGTQWKTLIHAPQETLTSTTLWSSCSSHGQRAFQPTQGPDSRHIHPHLQKQVCWLQSWPWKPGSSSILAYPRCRAPNIYWTHAINFQKNMFKRWKEALNRHFLQRRYRYRHVANRYMKRCSTSFIISIVPTKTTVRHYLTSIRMCVCVCVSHLVMSNSLCLHGL